MREYSIPALVDVPATASLADVVFTRAASEPHAVVMRGSTAGRAGQGRAGQGGRAGRIAGVTSRPGSSATR